MATARLQKELARLHKEPVPGVRAVPHPKDILEWHFVLEGHAKSPFEGGKYHGILKFPADYPFKPPSIMVLTPNGRFEPGKRICLSMSDYHPESWHFTWSVSAILVGLMSFMLENTPALGCISTGDSEKRQFARESMAFNSKDKKFRLLFPELVEEWEEEEKQKTNSRAAATTAMATALAMEGGDQGNNGQNAQNDGNQQGNRRVNAVRDGIRLLAQPGPLRDSIAGLFGLFAVLVGAVIFINSVN